MTTIAHATALGEEDRLPFAHAVALAAASGSRLVSVHASDGAEIQPWKHDADDLTGLWKTDSVEHENMVHMDGYNPVDTALDALRKLGPDLVVAGTSQRGGIARLLFGSRAEAIAQHIGVPTLLVPVSTDGFVNPHTGRIDISRVLLPMGDAEEVRVALKRVAWFADLTRATAVEATLLHVGAPEAAPSLELPERDGWTWRRVDAGGSLEGAIADAAEESCLLVMATRGQDSFSDALRGTRTERVLRRVECPLLSVPV